MPLSRDRAHFLFLNAGHFIDHLMTLVFATVAALALTREWGMSYAEIVPYATPGFLAFGVFSLPAGWLADRWSRHGMMAVFFIGIGLASIATGFARTPLEIAIGLFVVGVFAAIYHPVGLAMVVGDARNAGMLLGINGVFGNLGVGSAALITGFFIDNGGWRAAFFVPGIASALIGVAYALMFRAEIATRASIAASKPKPAQAGAVFSDADKASMARASAIVLVCIALSSLIFQSTGFALPKIFEERLGGIAGTATGLGWLTFVVFAVGSAAQLVTGLYLDRTSPRSVFLVAVGIQVVFFAIMPGLTDWAALLVAVAFMLGVFGQIPITDFMVAKMTPAAKRSSALGMRFVISFVVFATTIPFIAWVHKNWGFDTLFSILAVAAALVFGFVALLPARLPTPQVQPQPARA